MKAVIYARYSSDNQREESIDGQIRESKAFAERNSITVVGSYIDRALSAKTDNRPEFQRMIHESSKRLFDVVIVWKLDRFARNRYDSAHYKAILRKNGVKVVSATENISEGAEGIILEAMLEGMAEYYSAELSVKVKRGQTENALKAKFNGGANAFGYTVDSERHYQLDPITAPVIREMFERYADGERVTEILKDFTQRGIYTGKGEQLSLNSFRNILCNRKYLGEYRYGEIVIPDAIPAIVSSELFERAQARVQKNKRAPSRSKAIVEYLLTTKLFCGKCGTFMVGESATNRFKTTYNYYKCLSAKRKRGCTMKSVKKDWIERAVVQDTVNYVLQDSVIKSIAKELVAKQEQDDFVLPMLQQQLADTEKGLENLVNAIQQGMLTSTTKKRLEELEATKADIEIKILQANLQKDFLTEEHIILWISRFKGGDVGSKNYQRTLIDIFVNAVYLYEDRVVFTYNFKSESRTISLADIEGSDLTQCSPPSHYEPSRFLSFVIGGV